MKEWFWKIAAGCVLAALLSVTALAARSETDVSYSVSGGRIWFDAVSGTVTQCDAGVTEARIPATIDGARVRAIGESAFERCPNVLPSGVTAIGEWAFWDCGNLATVTLPVSVTRIGEGAFGNCKKLNGIYYAGSQAQWEAIQMGDHNADFLANAAINYNSGGQEEPEPAAVLEILSAPTGSGGSALTSATLSRLSAVTVPIRYQDSAARSVTFIVSFYAANGRLAGTGVRTVTADSGLESVTVSIGSGVSGAARVKVLALENGCPLIAAQAYAIN